MPISSDILSIVLAQIAAKAAALPDAVHSDAMAVMGGVRFVSPDGSDAPSPIRGTYARPYASVDFACSDWMGGAAQSVPDFLRRKILVVLPGVYVNQGKMRIVSRACNTLILVGATIQLAGDIDYSVSAINGSGRHQLQVIGLCPDNSRISGGGIVASGDVLPAGQGVNYDFNNVFIQGTIADVTTNPGFMLVDGSTLFLGVNAPTCQLGCKGANFPNGSVQFRNMSTLGMNSTTFGFGGTIYADMNAGLVDYGTFRSCLFGIGTTWQTIGGVATQFPLDAFSNANFKRQLCILSAPLTKIIMADLAP